MDNRLQATFMPRQSSASGEAYVRPKAPTNFLMLGAIVIFGIALVSTGGLYFFKSYLTSGNEVKKASVQQAIKNFEPELTKQLTVLKAQMDAGKSLLSTHKALTLFLDLLGSNTAQTVRFSDFDYGSTPDNKIQLTMKGEARSYNAIAFQSDVFSKISQLNSPMFTNLTLDDKGVISFSVSAILDPLVVTYGKFLNPFVPTASSTPTTSSTTPVSFGTTFGVPNGSGTGATTTLKTPPVKPAPPKTPPSSSGATTTKGATE